MFLPTRWTLQLPRQSFRALSKRPYNCVPHCIPQRHYSSKDDPPKDEPTKVEAVSNELSQQQDAENNLLSPVHIPEDPHGVLKETHPAVSILNNSSLVVQRQLEMMNVLVGFEQANKYIILDPHGNHVGYLAEHDHGWGNAIARQALRTHRSFTTHVFDKYEKEVLRFHRPLSYISSRIRVYDALGTSGTYAPSRSLEGTSPASLLGQSLAQISTTALNQMRIIGAAEQQWAPLRRKYNLFLARTADEATEHGKREAGAGDLPLDKSKSVEVVEKNSREIAFMQFAYVNEPLMSWDFSLLSEDNRLIGSVNRNFVGFARELFTDTGVYALRMDAAALKAEPHHIISKTGRKNSPPEQYPGMTLDQRAVMLATAVSIDFDYFSRRSGAGGVGRGFTWFPWWGGEAAAEEEAAEGAASAAARRLGTTESVTAGATGAGTIAGYEAMRHAGSPNQTESELDSQSPTGESPLYEEVSDYQADTRPRPSQTDDEPADSIHHHASTDSPLEDEVWDNDNDPWSSDDDWGGDGWD